MAVDISLYEMEQEARHIAGYYYKGFGSTIDMVINDALAYYRYPKAEYAYRVSKYLSRIEDFYSSIPFEELEGEVIFQPLFEVKDLLPDFRRAVNLHFMDPTKVSLEEVEVLGKKIVEKGRPYWESLVGLLEKIRIHPNSDSFIIEMVDALGRPWKFGFTCK